MIDNSTETNRRFWIAVRVLCGLRQEDVAEELGIHKSSVCRWELGEVSPRRYRAIALESVLNRHLEKQGLKAIFESISEEQEWKSENPTSTLRPSLLPTA